jgi:uncharacterized protein (TIGR03437 family)
MPTAVRGPATGVIGSNVYVVGGANSSTYVNLNQIYNTATDTWTAGAPMPTMRYVPGGAVVNNVLYVIGGKLNGNQLNVVEAYDPATNSWSTKAPLLIARDSVTAVVSNGIIYVVGGYSNSGNRLKSVESYNPATDTWTEEAPLLVGKSLGAVDLVGSTIVAADGLADSGGTGDNEGYNPTTNAWQPLQPDPNPRFNTCSASIAGQLYVAGGTANNSTPTSILEAYNLQNNQWTTLAPMPLASITPGQAEVGNLLYCFGGFDGSDFSNIYNKVQIYHPNAQPPVISAGGVVSASAFGGFTSVAPGSWIEIYGSNLAPDQRGWGSTDFNGVNAPTSLDETSVSIGGQSAFIDYISPGQVNAQVPSNVGTGLQQITVTTANGTSSPFNITVNSLEPGFLAPASFDLNGIQYAVATFADGRYVLPAGAISGASSSPAKPGDTVTLYGVGFGPVTPNTPAGQIVDRSNMLTNSVDISFGGASAAISYAGLAPQLVGLYQFNVVVPSVAAGNAVPLTFTLNGAPGAQTLYIAIQN